MEITLQAVITLIGIIVTAVISSITNKRINAKNLEEYMKSVIKDKVDETTKYMEQGTQIRLLQQKVDNLEKQVDTLNKKMDKLLNFVSTTEEV